MDFDALAYPEIVYIEGEEYKANRDMDKGTVDIPYTEEPDIGIGDVISLKSGKREIALKILDLSFSENSSLNIGTNHPHIAALKVENTTAKPHTQNIAPSTINIGTLNGEQVQVGNGNTQTVNISIHKLVEEVSKTNDPEAKTLLRKLLENSTVGSLIGAGASSLLGLL
ncbi:hypothetical protein L2712_02035 [Shewanella marisflavi]|uniref:hypothetical protein n=1 Tax=Shewanella marisflavi TaxID=260364 RepID=UPI00200C1BC6|nr:hypothetical protein [Shewanella marisflavi]MCL1040433.1 hypothetical protein [Shewanella marisflavi]